jgi:hypothetical protein
MEMNLTKEIKKILVKTKNTFPLSKIESIQVVDIKKATELILKTIKINYDTFRTSPTRSTRKQE